MESFTSKEKGKISPLSIKKGRHIILAPPSYGKTTAIVDAIYNNINNNQKTLVIIENKQGISSVCSLLKERYNIDWKSGIFIQSLDFNNRIAFNDANIILSHHHYYGYKGSTFDLYNKSELTLKSNSYHVIIDEVDNYLNRIKGFELLIKALYTENCSYNFKSYNLNTKKVNKDNDYKLKSKSDIISVLVNEDNDIELYPKTKTNGYGVDIFDSIKKALKKDTFKIVDIAKHEDSDCNFTLLKNQVKNNENYFEILKKYSTDLVKTLLLKSDRLILTEIIANNISRKEHGKVYCNFQSDDIPNMLNKLTNLTVLTATLNESNKNTLKNIKFEHIEKKIEVIDNLYIYKKQHLNKEIDKCLSKQENNVIFTSTKKQATMLANGKNDIVLTDGKNAIIPVGKSIKKYNTFVLGNSATGSRGTNFNIEIIPEETGINNMFFLGGVVTPSRKKIDVIDDKLIVNVNEYNVDTLLQNIGRLLRKPKEKVNIFFEDIDDGTFKALVERLNKNINANIYADNELLFSKEETVSMEELERVINGI